MAEREDFERERQERVRVLLTVTGDEDFVNDDQWTDRELQLAERIIKLEDEIQDIATRLQILIDGGFGGIK